MADAKPNILVIWGDDIGQSNLSIFTKGVMGYRTPNIDRIANEGMLFTDYYAEQSCTAGRAAFIMGQSVFRSGLSKVGLPGATAGMRAEDPTIAELLKPLGYATGQFGKNHLGDRDDHLPTMHGFDEFFGNLYHLNAEEEPETYHYPRDPAFRKKFGPRGVLKSTKDGKIQDTGPLTRKRMETVDEEFLGAAMDFIDRQHKASKPFFITDYPKGSRGFYDRENPELPGFLRNFDLIAPEGYGELASGSEREHDYATIIARIRETGENPAKYGWYLAMLRQGIPGSAGFGIGLERLTRYLVGLDSVWQASAYPKIPGVVAP